MRRSNVRSLSQGFTLIEMAIVLVIIGVLIGGVLKGQSLIQSARVSSMVSDLKGMQAAYLTFVARYHRVPGDWDQASQQIPGAVDCDTECGTGQIDSGRKSVLAFNHLSAAGLLSGSYTGQGNIGSPENSPQNPWGGVMQLISDEGFEGSNGHPVLHIKTGNLIPVTAMREIDQQLDDAQPARGSLRFSAWRVQGEAVSATNCLHNTTSTVLWRTAAAPPAENCGGAWILQ